MSNLTPAQIQERRAAARARWDKARQAAVVAAGAAGGIVASQTLTAPIVAAVAPRLAARKLTQERLEPVAERWFLHSRMGRIDRARLVREAAIKRPQGKPLSAESAAKPSHVGLYARLLHRHNSSDAAHLEDIKAAYRAATTDEHADQLLDEGAKTARNIQIRDAEIERLRGLIPRKKKPRRAAIATRRAVAWDIKLPNKLIVEAKSEAGTKHVRSSTKAFTRRPAHAILDPEDSKQIRTVLRGHADQVANDVKDHILATASRRLPKAQDELRAQFMRMATRQIGAAIRPGVRGGLGAAGIAAGLLAGAFISARNERHNPPGHPRRLNKANPGFFDENEPENSDFIPADPPGQNMRKPRTTSTAKHILGAAEAIESDLAAGVGRALAAWKDAVSEESIATPNEPGGLNDQLDLPLFNGMEPMDRATIGGIAAPSRLQPPPKPGDEGNKPRPKLLNFGFNTRSTRVEDYAKRYRYGRVREITDAQRKNIKQIIVDATKTGAPPAVIARKVRDVVGLTAYQAKIVGNYRALLETGDPRALTFALRDRRFDPTIKKALDDKKALSDAQVDKMVDVYQRRFIAYRAMTIARTEALRAANNGHVKTVTDFLDKNPDWTVAKTWISTEDDRTRPDHVGLHRQTVIGMQTPFVCESGETIRWPHDPQGAANQIINCRCTFMTTLIPRSAAAQHGPAAYGTPTPNFWEGPRQPYDIDDPDDIFGDPAYEPA